ncbi:MULTISPECIES: helix-turn-helix domain-containing protein [Halomicrobium]|uniref:Bacterio-opsin activator HTH domain protein n=2 Tax=Halomicrobium mukohataei TaxID=57705 RepID=C7P3W8_HALMD|nr:MULTISPECIES: helix-turn-helix domain-containing protein [Halomicrobium]ACV47790.1 Bacterio-opsin activator HTH domain protein [Halomicrobium mukohataei DSM 12286]QCD66239.1 helix-turn-helix domain-containing protein [Halomicrobium mukohataei]QFR21045.1 helix-turn-helix domain-containing protein [Halomicrobium sp. ZPS1]
MPRAELTLTIPEEVWIGSLSRSFPDAEFRILAAVPGEESGVGLTEITADELVAILGQMDESEAVTSLEILQRWEDTALVQFETSDPLLLFPVQGSGIPLEMPFRLSDGEARWEITAPQERLSALGQQLEEFGIPFHVERVSQHVETEQLLTGSQLELIQAAVENGYYDTPRDCSLTELASEVGIAKSTCSETLHRAEEKIVKEFVEELG